MRLAFQTIPNICLLYFDSIAVAFVSANYHQFARWFLLFLEQNHKIRSPVVFQGRMTHLSETVNFDLTITVFDSTPWTPQITKVNRAIG